MSARGFACALVVALAGSCAAVPPWAGCDEHPVQCPPPPWNPRWALNGSTVIFVANGSGFFDPSIARNFGMVAVDWSNARGVWQRGDPRTFAGEEALLEQARMIKAASPLTKVILYRNVELALGWMTTQRRYMYNASCASLFLRYKVPPSLPPDCVHRSTAPNSIYCETEGGGGGDQYFWDYRNPSAVEVFSDVIAAGATAGGSSLVDGLYLDDDLGLDEEHPHAPPRLNMTSDEVTAVRRGTQAAWNRTLANLISLGKYAWQAFAPSPPLPSRPWDNCSARMRTLCNLPSSAVLFASATTNGTDVSHLNATLSAFLIARTAHSWLYFPGWGWGNRPVVNPVLHMDVGVPLGKCSEETPGVFSRVWSRGTARLDCSTGTGYLPFPHTR